VYVNFCLRINTDIMYCVVCYGSPQVLRVSSSATGLLKFCVCANGTPVLLCLCYGAPQSDAFVVLHACGLANCVRRVIVLRGSSE